MTALELFTYTGLLMFAGLVLGYMMAAWKNLDASRWGLIGFLCPPALLILVLRARRQGPPIRRLSWDEHDTRDHARHNPPT